MHVLKCLAAHLVGACLLFSFGEASSTQRAPLKYITKLDDPVINAPSNRVNALSSFDLTFHLHNRRQRLKLTVSPNHDIIADGATVQYLAADGTISAIEEIDRLAHKVFKGDAWIQPYEGSEWTNVGWARVMVHRDGPEPIFEGVFRVDGNHHHIQTRSNYIRTRLAQDPEAENGEKEYMIIWRDSDIIQDTPLDLRRDLHDYLACSADGLSFNTNPNHPVYVEMMKRAPVSLREEHGFFGSLSTRSLLSERQIDGTTGGNGAGVNLTSSIGNTSGCPSARKVALIGIATDCTYTASFNSTASARENVINQINSASSQYESSFNLSLGIQNLTISEAACPATAAASAPWNVVCSDSVTIQDRLNLFSGWRGNQTDTNAWWTLLSTCNTGQAIGLAWLGQACVTGSSTNSNETVAAANVVVRTSQEWQVIAHESGHTLGAVHDCTSQTCNDGTTVAAQQCCPLSTASCDAGGQFIMNPASMPGVTKFSPCSIGNICSALGRNSVKSACFVANKDVTTLITGSQCGNGIVEVGEECDCGGTSGCGENSCCNPTTCKLTTNSQCDPSNEDCCTSSCQFAGAGTVCRASTGFCDPQETCSGTNATCPPDQTTPDGTTCGNSSQSLTCASGQCTSRDAQCKSIMGSYTQGNDTYACDSSDCQISCASPEFGSNVCYSMKQNFLDGTSCGGGGKCSNGVCNGSSVGGEITSWIDQNRTLVIGLAAGIGGFIVILLLCCIVSCFRRRGRARRAPLRPPPGWAGTPASMSYAPQWGGYIPTPPPVRRSGRWGGDDGPPPPVYLSGPSVRYA